MEKIMDLTFQPSLQHLASVKVTLMIYNENLMDLFQKLVELDRNGLLSLPSFVNRIQVKWTNKKKTTSSGRLFHLLPKSFQKRVIQISQPLIKEIYYWFRDHYRIVKGINKTQFMNCLCWKLEGTIDRTKTAEHLIRDESIDKRVRFIVACIYFLQNDVLHLWENMTSDERETILYIDSNNAVYFWVEWLRRKDNYSCIAEFFREYAHNLIDVSNFDEYTCSHIRLSSFFSELNILNKSYLLLSFWPRASHVDDLRQCYNLLEKEERFLIFHGCLLMREVLARLLDWPLQTLFLDAVNQISSSLVSDSYEYLLFYIVKKKLMNGMQDYDYQELLIDLWSQIPDSYKVQIQRERTFTIVRAAMSYDKKNTTAAHS